MCNSIMPGDSPSYEICRIIYEYHPLGRKLVEAPIELAQSQARKVSVNKGPEDRVKKAFDDEWDKIGADGHIFNLERLSRIYGIGSLAMIVNGETTDKEVNYKDLWQAEIAFSAFDPLNTSGSLVLNQNPNAMDFQKTFGSIAVQGQTYHRSRVVVKLNEEPIYLGYTTSAYGYVGRSVYQRTLYPLKSFVSTMKADDMIARKCGIIVAAMKMAGSIANKMMQTLTAAKRDIVKEAETDNVINITPDERIDSIDLTNVNVALDQARKNILNNIASGAGMPAILVNEETFAEGFGEGTEDARHVALFIDGFRKKMASAYEFFDRIVQYRAWNQDFFKSLQAEFPEEYSGKTYDAAFYDWVESFEAPWPSLLTEPESEKAKAEDVKLKGMLAFGEIYAPMMDPENKAATIMWIVDNMNAMETMFSSPLMLDQKALEKFEPPVPAAAPGEPKPFAAQDSAGPRIRLAGIVK